MATGAEAIEVAVTATGMSASTVGRVARALREAGHDLWPQAKPGGGKNGKPVRPHHLVNLALALSADPITAAPAQVLWMRNLVPVSSGESKPFLFGSSLGEALDAYLASGAPNKWLRVEITRWGSRPPWVDLRSILTEGEWCHYAPSQQDIAFSAPYIPEGALNIVFTIPNALLRALADLWISATGHLDTTTQGRLTIDTETTKAAGAPPPNRLRAKSKQAPKPASVSAEQLTHAQQNRQSRSRGLSFPSSSEKVRRHEDDPDRSRPA